MGLDKVILKSRVILFGTFNQKFLQCIPLAKIPKSSCFCGFADVAKFPIKKLKKQQQKMPRETRTHGSMLTMPYEMHLVLWAIWRTFLPASLRQRSCEELLQANYFTHRRNRKNIRENGLVGNTPGSGI